MSTHRRLRPKVDNNQPQIVKQLRDMGYSVEVNHDDIIVGVDGVNFWFEIKDPDKTLRKDGLVKPDAFKESQIQLMSKWDGQYDVVWTLEEIEEIIDDHFNRAAAIEVVRLEIEITEIKKKIRNLQKRYSALTGRDYEPYGR